uniref:Uncharacterized protein n=1 Tax=Hucho hucho TaxID=62062 RepID=A0A4W5LJE8_9TELE
MHASQYVQTEYAFEKCPLCSVLQTLIWTPTPTLPCSNFACSEHGSMHFEKHPKSISFSPIYQVCEWRSPEQLKDLLDLGLREGGEAHPQILQRCRDAIRYSVKTGHPLFFNQLYAGMDPYSLVGRFITEAINPSLYTYEVAPVFLLTEEAVLEKMIEIIGWQEGGDGIFSPGFECTWRGPAPVGTFSRTSERVNTPR